MKTKVIIFLLIVPFLSYIACSKHMVPERPESPGYQIVYKNDQQGNALIGSKEKLISFIRAGADIKIAWGVKGKNHSIEHLSIPIWIAVLDESEVVAHLDPQVLSRIDWNNLSADYSDNTLLNQEWRVVITTKGEFDAVWYDRVSQKVSKRRPQNHTIIWFAKGGRQEESLFSSNLEYISNNKEILLGQLKKTILKEDGHDQFFYWEMKDENHLWDTINHVPSELAKYRDSLNIALGNTLYETSISKEAATNLEKPLIKSERNGDRINALLIHTGSIGEIREINQIEAQILNYQIARFPMFSHPTEFHAFITKNDESGMIRIYIAASDTEWPPHPHIILKELKKEMNDGWRLIKHLHNHYCNKEDNFIGILAPSLADAQYYKMLKDEYKLDHAYITNGFHTVEINHVDFDKFESH